MNHLQSQLDALCASDSLKKKVKKLIKKNDALRLWKRIGCTAAAVVVVCTTALNCMPSVAAAAYEVPLLGYVARVVTLNRFAFEENGYAANINVPQIEGLLDPELEARLNQQFKDQADVLIAAVETDVKDLKAEFDDEVIHYSIEADYAVKTDTDDLLAIDNYVYTAVGSSSTVHSFYTIDKRNSQLLTLAGLFAPEADYVETLSAYLRQEMERLNSEEEGLFWVGQDMVENFTQIKADQNFYINADHQLVICFDKYEVAAGAQGSPEFVIPSSVIADIAQSDLLKK